jgi:hypothetical protein
MILAPQLLLVRAAAVALVALLLVGVGAWLGYRQGTAKGDRLEAVQMRGERDAWRAAAEDSLARERDWLRRAGEVQEKWNGALETIDALQQERPRLVREVIREGKACPDVSIDPATFGVLNAAVDATNAPSRAAPGS